MDAVGASLAGVDSVIHLAALGSVPRSFFNVYGRGQRAGHAYAAVIPVFIEALLSARALPINGDGSHSRDFTYVGTVCRILVDAAVRRVGNPEPVNLAFGTKTTLTTTCMSPPGRIS